MTFETVQSDCERLLRYCSSTKDKILHLDLSEINHCDSAGLALLIEAKRLCRERKKICKIIGISKSIQALAEFCGVSEILEIS